MLLFGAAHEAPVVYGRYIREWYGIVHLRKYGLNTRLHALMFQLVEAQS